MAVTVRIPTQLRELSGGASEVTADGDTVASVLAGLETAHPGFNERLFDEGGQLRRFHVRARKGREQLRACDRDAGRGDALEVFGIDA